MGSLSHPPSAAALPSPLEPLVKKIITPSHGNVREHEAGPGVGYVYGVTTSYSAASTRSLPASVSFFCCYKAFSVYLKKKATAGCSVANLASSETKPQACAASRHNRPLPFCFNPPVPSARSDLSSSSASASRLTILRRHTLLLSLSLGVLSSSWLHSACLSWSHNGSTPHYTAGPQRLPIKPRTLLASFEPDNRSLN